MKLVLSRQYQDDETKGLLTVFDGIEDVFSCKTLELPWKDNQHNISCIPENKYYCEKHIRPSGAKSFLVKDVPDRTDILIHSGNFAAGDNVDTEGCILVGMRFTDVNQDGHIDVLFSRLVISVMWKILPVKFELYVL